MSDWGKKILDTEQPKKALSNNKYNSHQDLFKD